jgi:hypothetical protein
VNSLKEISAASNLKRCTFIEHGENRCRAGRCNCGDNLSVRFHIQNSISLTIAMLPRIIWMSIQRSGSRSLAESEPISLTPVSISAGRRRHRVAPTAVLCRPKAGEEDVER